MLLDALGKPITSQETVFPGVANTFENYFTLLLDARDRQERGEFRKTLRHAGLIDLWNAELKRA